MKRSPTFHLLLATAAALLVSPASGQTPNAQAQAQAQAQMQAQALSQQANALLANPALLFSQLDVDNDGLLNLNEFAPISQLSTQPLVIPNGGQPVIDPNSQDPTRIQNPNQNPIYNPGTGVRPVTTPNGTFAPGTGVAPVAPSPSIPNTNGRTIPQRPGP